MLFNSKEFALFLVVAFFLYWFVFNRKITARNAFLVVISYIFYAWWDWRFLFLLIFSTYLDYFTGLKMSQADDPSLRKKWFWLSIVINLGFLAFFKYYNFFIESFADLLTGIGLQVNMWTLKIILPVGISFYTFHGMSYVIDIYHRRIKATENFTDYAVFVSYFPLLVAGPIERATHLLPQFKEEKKFSYEQAASGMRLILWGFFKKSVVADNCAPLVNDIFSKYDTYSTPVLILGAVFFAFQIYGDFSGYSDIARGVSRLFGFELLVNFRTPYFARDIAEFWRRWHISLTTWFRDYVYIPLGGSRGGKGKAVINTFIVFLLSGLWHGANWTFVIWGLINALLFLPLLLIGSNRNHIGDVASDSILPSFKDALRMVITFALVCLTWIFFRAEDTSHAIDYLVTMTKNFALPVEIKSSYKIALATIGVLLLFDWLGRKNDFDGYIGNLRYAWQRRLIYVILFSFIFLFGSFNKDSFIYFQF